MSDKPNFVHLHTHSEFSLLDGAGRVTELVARAKEFGMPALAITDHGTMYATVSFYEAARQAGIKPLIGCEAYLAPRSRFDKETKEDRTPHHLTILAMNQLGYRNLTNLVSLASIEGFYSRPRIDRELLEKYHEGLIVLSGCPKGEIPRLLAQDRFEEAEKAAAWYKELLGDRFYLELQDLSLPDFAQNTHKLVQLGKKLGLPLVATNDTHYVSQEDAHAQDVLLCIQTGAFLDQEKRMGLGSQEFYLKSAEEMSLLFKDVPEAISNTLVITERCNVELEMGKLHLPNFSVPAGETPESFMEKLVWDGIKEKYGITGESGKVLLPPEIIDRVKYELMTIEKMGYTAYFLIVQDFIAYARSQGIQVGPGRGSAAGSIVSYALGITNVDPLKYGLIFERFLNSERISMPDIDIDFCFQRRNEVVEYVARKYGRDHVAQIVTFGTMAARGAIRDVGRVQRVPLAYVDKIAKLIPAGPDVDLESAFNDVKELKALYEKDEIVKNLIDTARKLEGLARHASVHAAGVVISEKPLTEYCPLQKLDENVIVTQFPMGDLEKIGLLKMDFLGLRNLTMIAEAVALIKERHGVEINISTIPLDDYKVYHLLETGETSGLFQLESRGMRTLIKDLRPNSFDEIIALLALYRPGPLESGMVEDYVKRKHRQITTKYLLPELESILKETYGVILYQEQVMSIASKVAGFTLGQADLLRRAMGKKKAEEMEQQKEFFVNGAVKRGVSHHKAVELFNLCAKFAGYGFNKSHSTAYGFISYQTAYLKANYPIEFLAALLTSVIGNTDKTTGYINECRRLNIKMLLPDINKSQINFTVTDEGICFGLAAIRNVGIAAIENIMKVRNEGGPFKSIADFCERVDSRATNKKVIESLIKAGAFDLFGGGRAYQLAKLSNTMSRIAAELKERQNGQESLFTIAPMWESGQADSRKPIAESGENIAVDEFPPEQLLAMEKEMLGHYISSHPLEYIRESLEAQASTKIVDVPEMKEGDSVTIGGILSDLRKITTKKGDLMCVCRIEDMSGHTGLVVFPKAYETCSVMLNNDAVVIVKGKINRDLRTDENNVMADSVMPMEEMTKVRVLHLELLDLQERAVLDQLKTVIISNKGEDPVYLRLDGNQVVLGNGYSVNITPELIGQLEGLLGGGAVSVEFKAVKKRKPKKVEVNA